MNTLQANLCLLCVTFCWSTEVIIFARIPAGTSPYAPTCITSIAGAALLFICFFDRIVKEIQRSGTRIIKRTAILSVMNCIYSVLYLYGLKSFDVSTGAFTLSLTAVVLPIVLFIQRNRVGGRTWISSVLIMIGSNPAHKYPF